MLIGTQLIGFGGGVRGYRTQGVVFDGVNDYLNRNGIFTGAANNKLWTCGFWFRNLPQDGVTRSLIGSSGIGPVQIEQRNGNFTMRAERVASGAAYLASSSFTVDSDWHHFVFSIDLSSTSKRYYYADAVDVGATHTTYNTATDIAWASDDSPTLSGNTWIGRDLNNGATEVNSRFSGEIADLWMSNVYIDLSIPANLQAFIRDGKPVNLGSNGSNPNGTAPLLYLSAAGAATADVFATNKGSGGGMTLTGALTTSSTSPSD